MSIHDVPPKIKTQTVGKMTTFLNSPKGHNFLVLGLILGVSVASYSLGVMSTNKEEARVVIQTNPSLVGIDSRNFASDRSDETTTTTTQKQDEAKVSADTGKNNQGAYVASKKGKKYYPVGCPGSKSLSKTNLIYFKDKNEAESKGYTESTSCK